MFRLLSPASPIRLPALVSALTLLFLSSGPPAHLQAQDWSAVEIQVQPLSGGVYMLVGRGGNIGLTVGPDGAFLVDDQFAPLTDKILEAVASVTDQPVKFVLNTHWHGDHTGGNENMGEAGALIVAHGNVRARMSVEQIRGDNVTPASPDGALPVVTFDRTVNFYLNDDELHVFHVPRAHTDGDAIVFFREANVVHMGDTYFNGGFPYIDTGSGGSIDGVIAAMDRVLMLADGDTQIIPGHGALSNAAELRTTRDMLQVIRDRVAVAKADGASAADVVGMTPAQEWDAEFGGGFINQERLVRAIYATIP